MCLRQTTFLPSSESNCVFYCGNGIVRTQVIALVYSHSSNKHGSLKHIFLDSFPCLILLGILVLLLTDLQGLASLQRSLSLRLALLALQTQHQLLGLLGLHPYRPSLGITFLWKIGLVWPPKPFCLASYLLLPRQITRFDSANPEESEKPFQPCTEWPCAPCAYCTSCSTYSRSWERGPTQNQLRSVIKHSKKPYSFTQILPFPRDMLCYEIVVVLFQRSRRARSVWVPWLSRSLQERSSFPPFCVWIKTYRLCLQTGFLWKGNDRPIHEQTTATWF